MWYARFRPGSLSGTPFLLHLTTCGPLYQPLSLPIPPARRLLLLRSLPVLGRLPSSLGVRLVLLRFRLRVLLAFLLPGASGTSTFLLGLRSWVPPLPRSHAPPEVALLLLAPPVVW